MSCLQWTIVGCGALFAASIFGQEGQKAGPAETQTKPSTDAADPADTPAKLRLQVRHLFAELNFAYQTGQRPRFSFLVSELRKLAPQSPEAEYFQGLLHYRDGERIKAAPHLQEAVRRDPDFDRAWNLLGTLLSEAGRFHEARSAFQRASLLNPYDPHYALNLAMSSYVLDDLPEALLHAQRAADLKPNASEAHYLLGEVSLAANQPAAALTALEKAYQLGHKSVELAALFVKAAEATSDAAQLARVLEILGSDDRIPIARQIAEARARWGECDRALRLYDTRILPSAVVTLVDRMNYVTCALRSGRDPSPAFQRLPDSEKAALEKHLANAQKQIRFLPRDGIVSPTRP